MNSVYPSLAFIAVAMPVVMLLAAVTGAGISRRMKRLQGQVNCIAEGDFEQMELSEGDDEIRALGVAVNRMATMLAGYEDQVRHAERMRTLAQLGGGVAHQLRNSATGCGMALELHADEYPAGHSCESLDVARQQLRLMEEYIQRFLRLGKPTEELRTEFVCIGELVSDLLPLVQPAARHRGVELEWDGAPGIQSSMLGDATALSQLVINLLLNAIEAAASCQAKADRGGKVVVALTNQNGGRIRLTISDSGDGPAADLSDRLFQPFVSEKPDGIGLGLCVASDVAARHGGQITWNRAYGLTTFVVEFPLARAEVQCA